MKRQCELTLKKGEKLAEVEKYVEKMMDYYNIQNDYFGNILMAVTEACTILMKSENGNDVLKIRAEKSRQGMDFRLVCKASDHKKPMEELDKAIMKQKFDRELFLIKTLTDRMEFENDRKTLNLNFIINGINYQRTLERVKKMREYLCESEKIAKRNE